MIDVSKIVMLGDVPVINCTPHVLKCLYPGGLDVEIEPCGATLEAAPRDTVVGQHGTVELVSITFGTSESGLKELAEIEAKAPPGTLVVGSTISARAYPGRVVSPIPAKGYERVPPGQKKMNPKRFNIF